MDAQSKPIVADGYAPTDLLRGARVRAGNDNTGMIYVGPSTVSTVDGFPLDAGEEVDVQIRDIHKVYVVAIPAGNPAQVVTVANLNAGGKFTLTYNGATTTALARTSTHQQVEAALVALASIGIGNVSVSGNAGGPYTVTFIGALAKLDAALITGDCVNELQTIAVTNGVAGDQITLTCNAQDAAPVAYGAAASVVQSALEALTAIGAGNVAVTAVDGGYTAEFIAAKADIDVPAITGVGGKNEVQTITVSAALAGDMMVLTCGANSTDPLAYNVSSTDLQTALRALLSIGAGNCTVTGEGPYAVEFISGKAKTDMPAITGVGGKNEIQTIAPVAPVAGDTMVLTCGADSTGALAYDISSTDLQTALRALTSIGAGNCTVTGEGPYVVEFISGKAKTDMPAITGVGGKNEIQTISVSGGLAGDMMVLTCGANSTDPLAYNVSSTDLQTALRALASIGAGNCTVTGEGPYAVEFISGKAKTDMAAITGVGGKNEKQTITLDVSVAGGTFTLTYIDQTTDALDWDASVTEVADALKALSNIGDADVSVVAGDPSGWVVEFTGALAQTNVAMLVGDGTNLTGADVVKDVTIVQTVQGNSLTVAVVETYKGHVLTIGVVETFKGNTLAVGVVETHKGNELTVVVTETIKGDPDGTVTSVSTSQASDGCDYSWIAE